MDKTRLDLRTRTGNWLRNVAIPDTVMLTILGPELWIEPRIYSVCDWLQVRM